MVNVIKPKEKWYVKVVAPSELCPHLYFPANYWGCVHPDRYSGGEIELCCKETCPILTNEYNEKKNYNGRNQD